MIPLRTPALLTITTAAIAAVVGGIVWWRRTHQKSPAERERLRCMAVNLNGRLIDGALIDAPYSQDASSDRDLLFYSYRIAGVEYSAAQDVSALASRMKGSVCRAGTPVTVKYDPRSPSNSIIICDLWSGLPAQPEDAIDDLRGRTSDSGLAGAA